LILLKPRAHVSATNGSGPVMIPETNAAPFRLSPARARNAQNISYFVYALRVPAKHPVKRRRKPELKFALRRRLRFERLAKERRHGVAGGADERLIVVEIDLAYGVQPNLLARTGKVREKLARQRRRECVL
jgi:hypothetical protein